MKKTLIFTALGLLVISSTGCMGTKSVSYNITNGGTVEQQDIVFPELDKAWQKEGQYPNSENLSKIRPGIVKDELYQLIGRPHFSEAQHAREWDYIMKFRQADDSVKICQYKVIFDKDYKGQQFYWKPADCAQYAQPQSNTIVPVVAPIVQENINLSADTLFAFDRYSEQDILPNGKNELDELASKLISYQQKGDSKISIVGHTDYLGDDGYNMTLSMRRAMTIRNYLINRGVDSRTLTASGAGETQPVKQCDNNLSRPELINCLQPNRRVELGVSVYQR